MPLPFSTGGSVSLTNPRARYSQLETGSHQTDRPAADGPAQHGVAGSLFLLFGQLNDTTRSMNQRDPSVPIA